MRHRRAKPRYLDGSPQQTGPSQSDAQTSKPRNAFRMSSGLVRVRHKYCSTNSVNLHSVPLLPGNMPPDPLTGSKLRLSRVSRCISSLHLAFCHAKSAIVSVRKMILLEHMSSWKVQPRVFQTEVARDRTGHLWSTFGLKYSCVISTDESLRLPS